MRTANRQTKRTLSDIPTVVLIVDNDRANRRDLCSLVRDQFGDRYTLLEANTAKEALAKLQGVSQERVAIMAVDLALALGDNIEPGLELIRHLRQQFPQARILGYTLLPLSDEARDLAMQAGASSYVRANQVGDVMTRIFLENELHDLDRTSPLVNRVLNTINIAISIQDVDMNILWSNDRNLTATGVKDYALKCCWKCYHGFENRSCACSECVAWSVIEETKRRINNQCEDPAVQKEGSMLLPIRGEIWRVEVSAAPFLNRERTEVLAVIEATRFTTDDWKRESPPDKRLEEVIQAARKMTRYASGDRACTSVAVYYQPKGTSDLYLFCRSAETEVGPPRTFFLEKELSSVHKQVLTYGGARIVPAIRPGREPSQFLWSARGGSGQTNVLIEATFFGDKPEDLFSKDLEPYWRYVQTNFEEAHASRDRGLTTIMHNAVQEFVAATKDIPDDTESSQTSILEKAVACIRQVLNPMSAHVRTLDRISNCLIKRSGFGTYFKVAPEKRMLNAPLRGSALVVAKREDIWETKPSLKNIRDSIDTELTAEDSRQLERMSGYALLPLVFGQRVLGSLNVQFEDDSLFRDTKKEFLKMLSSALGSSLGRRVVMQERKEMMTHLRTLDQMMFEDTDLLDPKEQEMVVVRKVAQKLFDMTYAEMVVYYEYDPAIDVLRLIKGTEYGPIPPEVKPPAVLSADFGVIGMVAREGHPMYVNDYRSEKWADVRAQLMRSLKEPSERAFCEWIGCEAAAPILVDEKVEGVLVALSPIPNWLTSVDFAAIDEFVFKTGLCLKAIRVRRQLRRDLEAMESLRTMALAMGRASDVNELFRIFLLTLTTSEVLQFSRAIMFVKSDQKDGRFEAAYAIGSVTQEVAESRWKEADGIPLENKVDACFRDPGPPREGDLRLCIAGLSIRLEEEESLSNAFASGKLAYRRRGQPHIVNNTRLQTLLRPPEVGDIEYVFVPLRSRSGDMSGIAVADRAFLQRSSIAPEELALLQLVCNEYMLMKEALESRRREEESIERLALGVTYTLRTRAALLEAHLFRLKQSIGDKSLKALEGMDAAVRFFNRAGTTASKYVRAQKRGVACKQAANLNAAVFETIQILDDPRISVELPKEAPMVVGEKGALQDILLELLANARDFTNRETGRIEVRVSVSGNKPQVDILDDGPGILPELRPHLFEMFYCYPASRMASQIGLGLAYARTLSRACGGDIVEIGQFGKGAHFVLTLLLAKENSV